MYNNYYFITFKPYLVILGIILVLGLIHKGINWVFLTGNR